MFLVISYDIVDDQKRKKLADLLKDYGCRVQYSVFEFDLEKKFIDQMIKEASAIIDSNEDSLRVYCLCEECARKVMAIGNKNTFDTGNSIVI